MMQILNEMCSSYSVVKRWWTNFLHGDFETHDTELFKKPSELYNFENVDPVQDVIFEILRHMIQNC